MADEHQCNHEGELATLTELARAHDQDIRTLFTKHDQLITKLDQLIPAVARLEVKSGFYGAVGGIMAALLTIGIALAAKLM